MKETLLRWLRRPSSRNVVMPLPAVIEICSIPNGVLSEGDIPGEDANWDEWSGIPSFAASFNGYDIHLGIVESQMPEVGTLDQHGLFTISR